VSHPFALVEGTSFRFPAGPFAPRQARSAAERVMNEVYEPLTDTTLLLVSELVTNSVRHAGLGPENYYVEMRISTHDHRVKVEVIDPGGGFVPSSRTGPRDRVGGWGLFMVEQLACCWGVDEGTPTTVWFELPVPEDAVATAS
jgi:anti-sigma regulatory factor (Ser/Thr protein kinase)